MTDNQPEALRLADVIDRLGLGDDIAVELRRLHQSEREGWRYANELEQERKRLHEVNAELVEALKLADAMLCCANMDTKAVEKKIRKALRKATGEQHG